MVLEKLRSIFGAMVKISTSANNSLSAYYEEFISEIGYFEAVVLIALGTWVVVLIVAAFIIFGLIYFVDPESYIVYFVFPLLGFFLCSSKIQCRAAVLTQTPSDKIGELTAFYQAATYLILIVMSFSISCLAYILSPKIIFLLLGVLMLLFSVYIWNSYRPKELNV